MSGYQSGAEVFNNSVKEIELQNKTDKSILYKNIKDAIHSDMNIIKNILDAFDVKNNNIVQIDDSQTPEWAESLISGSQYMDFFNSYKSALYNYINKENIQQKSIIFNDTLLIKGKRVKAPPQLVGQLMKAKPPVDINMSAEEIAARELSNTYDELFHVLERSEVSGLRSVRSIHAELDEINMLKESTQGDNNIINTVDSSKVAENLSIIMNNQNAIIDSNLNMPITHQKVSNSNLAYIPVDTSS